MAYGGSGVAGGQVRPGMGERAICGIGPMSFVA